MNTNRFKDFDKMAVAPVYLEYKDVVVRSQSLRDQSTYNNLRKKNTSSVSKYQIKDQTGKPSIPLAIEYQGIPVGEVTVWSIDSKQKHCMISYWVDEDFRRKKIGTYAVALTTDYCFLTLDMNEVEAPVQEDNIASKELLMKLSYAIAGYETFTGIDDIRKVHETYLLVKPENGIKYTLVDFLEMMAQPPEE